MFPSWARTRVWLSGRVLRPGGFASPASGTRGRDGYVERLKRALAEAHEWLHKVVRPGDIVVDATMGNGHDTTLLAGLVGPAGRVVAFDIQADALARTAARLEEAGLRDRCLLVHEGHEGMEGHLARVLPEDGTIRACVFNLGWLPGGDHAVGTHADTTIRAAESALARLDPQGMMLMVVYYGGRSGFAERDAVLAWAAALDCRRWTVRRTDFPNGANCPPFLLAFEANPAGG